MQNLSLLQHNNYLFGLRKPRSLPGRFFAAVASIPLVLALLVLAVVLSASVGCNSPSGAGSRPLTAQEERGRGIYEARCAVCHDAYSTHPRQGPGLEGLFRKKYLPSGAPANDDRVRDSFMLGRRNMPPFQSVLDDQQVSDLMAYLHSL